MDASTKLTDMWTSSPGYRRELQRDDQIAEVLASLDLSRGCVLVDVGCGNGAFALAASRTCPDCAVIAVDALPGAALECGRRFREGSHGRVHALAGSAEWIPVTGGCADRVLCRNVLHHLPPDSRVWSEFARVTRASGRVVLEAPVGTDDDRFGRAMDEAHFCIDGTHRRTYRHPDHVCARLVRHGFRIVAREAWTFASPLQEEQRAHIVRVGAEELLGMHRTADGAWRMKMPILRVTAAMRG